MKGGLTLVQAKRLHKLHRNAIWATSRYLKARSGHLRFAALEDKARDAFTKAVAELCPGLDPVSLDEDYGKESP